MQSLFAKLHFIGMKLSMQCDQCDVYQDTSLQFEITDLVNSCGGDNLHFPHTDNILISRTTWFHEWANLGCHSTYVND